MVCCHFDGDPTNNRLENLRWDTPQSNADDMVRHGTRRQGEAVWLSKLKEAKVVEIRRLATEGCSARELADRFGVSKANITAIVRRRTWKHLP
jgi:hypothetical protein